MHQLLLSSSFVLLASAAASQVTITGTMRNTMFNGQLAGLIAMDSIAVPGMYGLGPLAFLRGELLLLDGRSYVATATSDSTMHVAESTDAGAPFFVYEQVHQWVDVVLPDSVTSLGTLDHFLTSFTHERDDPFAFRLTGMVTGASIHIVDLPPGAEVHSPEDAHRGRKTYHLAAVNSDVIGFFSTHHKAVFTHHDTNIHVHLITRDRNWMGHVEELTFDPRSMQLQFAVP